MAEYKNAEIRQSGNVIRVNVNVDVSVPVFGPFAGKIQWSGSLLPPNNTGLLLGENYTLAIPDHQPAKIEITDEANPVDGIVRFKGLGEFPTNLSQRKVSAK